MRAIVMTAGKNKGFTLVEAAILSAVLGLILCLSIPFIVKNRCEHKYKVCTSNVKSIFKELEKFYFKNNGRYPTEDEYKSVFASEYFQNALPVCPVDKSPYIYKLESSHNGEASNYILYCSSEDAHNYLDKKGFPKFDKSGSLDPADKRKK